MYEHDNCPKCDANFQGEPIPENIREHYSEPYFWRREIGIDGFMLGLYDGTVAIQCPDCKSEFPRGESDWAKDLFKQYQELKNGTI